MKTTLTFSVISLSQLNKYLQVPNNPNDLGQAQRVFHGRGHGYEDLHHVTVDWLPPVVLITLFASEGVSEIEGLADQMLSLFPACKSVQCQHRYRSSAPIEVIRGDRVEQLAVQENDLQFYIRLEKTQNTGLFLDMSNGRKWVQSNSKEKRVLNLFAYTCGFSVAAIAGEAKSVLNVDMSRSALSAGRENHRLNQQSLEQVSFEKLDVFKSFGRLKRRGPFDLLICDPPTFQQGSIDVKRDYPKILRRLDDFMAPEGLLLLCLNSPDLGREYLINHMMQLAPGYKLVNEIQPPAVYVEEQNKGLKVLCFKKGLSC